MADLKTTQERRDRFRAWLRDDAHDHLSVRAWCVAEDACHDVDTLLSANAAPTDLVTHWTRLLVPEES